MVERKGNSKSEQVSSEEKIARLLALLIVKEIESGGEKVRLLRSAGFQVGEISELLNMTENAASVADHRAKKLKK